MNNILIDTCFWYALYNPKDSDHHKANDLVDYLDLGKIVMPYPVLYETLNTKFTRNKLWVEGFEKILKNKNVQFIDDSDYKESALALTFDSVFIKNRPLSLVDIIIRIMLEDVNLKIDYLISFNTGDFIDLCRKKRIGFIYE